ncbi:MAG: winged helix DNA-binding protein [Hyphomicrobiales bacterium]|nr:winged helix DNA-binding protein [Hyphomicrobiales bacterium]
MSVALDFARVDASVDEQALKAQYLSAIRMIERVHRLLLDVIKDEFERIGRTDVNSVQALLLFHIGDAELTAGELRTRGYYLGSNVSYNLKKLVHSGYIHHKRSPTDRRSVRVHLTPKGKEVCQLVNKLFERQLTMIEKVGGVSVADFRIFNQIVQRLERFWGDQIRYRL